MGSPSPRGWGRGEPFPPEDGGVGSPSPQKTGAWGACPPRGRGRGKPFLPEDGGVGSPSPRGWGRGEPFSLEGWAWGAQEGQVAGSRGLTAGLSKNRRLVSPQTPGGISAKRSEDQGWGGRWIWS